MKKILTFIVIFMCLPFSMTQATVETDVWSYVFHLQIQDGILAKNSDFKFFYDPIPGDYVTSNEQSGEYNAQIISGKGVTLSTVWFSAPNTLLVAKNKKILDVRTPYFANADRVVFYDSAGKQLFSESLRGSSFCNENNKCDKEVGENYQNCSMDCPAPAIAAPSMPVIPPTTNLPIVPSIEEGAPPALEEAGTEPRATDEISRTQSAQEKRGVVIPITIGLFLILTALVGMVYMKKLKNAAE